MACDDLSVLELLLDQEPPATRADARLDGRRRRHASQSGLGNTVSVCRKCYIHPDVIVNVREGDAEKPRKAPQYPPAWIERTRVRRDSRVAQAADEGFGDQGAG